MSKTSFKMAFDGQDGVITVFLPDQENPLSAHSSHKNFEKIRAAAFDDNAEVDPDWFSLEKAISTRFAQLSDRVKVEDGVVFMDGKPVDNALVKQVIRFLDEGVEDWKPLINFFEKVEANPNIHSRDQFFVWLERHNITITDSGNVVLYKGVQVGADGVPRSIHAGPAIVNGEDYHGYVPNEIDSVIELPRDQVQWDPTVGCSTGLHAGTWNYASGFGRGVTLEVHVDPSDVVSVPTDCDAQKVRVCRYTVVDKLDSPHYSAYQFTADSFDDDWDEDEEGYGFEDEDELKTASLKYGGTVTTEAGQRLNGENGPEQYSFRIVQPGSTPAPENSGFKSPGWDSL